MKHHVLDENTQDDQYPFKDYTKRMKSFGIYVETWLCPVIVATEGRRYEFSKFTFALSILPNGFHKCRFANRWFFCYQF